MSPYEALALLLTVTAAFAYLNHRFLRLPPSIGLMTMSLALSFGLLAIDALGIVHVAPTAVRLLDRVALNETLLHGMLGALLFAGALHVNLDDLRQEGVAIGVLALGGTLLSTLLVGACLFSALPLLGLTMSFGHCMLFGALISPTDPIAVLGILREAKIPRRLEIQIAGESLFNDGVGVVIFLTVLGVVTKGDATPGGVALLFLREAVGGVLFGAVGGYVAYRLLRSIDHYQTELLVTLALVLGGYALGERIHISAPIAAVVSGVLVGNHGRTFAMSDVTRDHLDKFWSLVDEVLNSILFVLLGLEMIRLHLSKVALLAGLIAVVLVLIGRFVSVAIPVVVLRRLATTRGATWILTWGGLRGGISVALALSLPNGRERDLIVVVTYVVVVFSVLVQGLTLGRLARGFQRWDRTESS